MDGIIQLMLLFLIICSIAVSVTKDMLTSVVIYMAYSMIMSVIWITLESPDLAITEAAVGAGVTSLLFFLALKKIHAIDARNEVRKAHAKKSAEVTQMQTNDKNNLDKRAKAAVKWLQNWLDVEEGALEREMYAAQQQEAAGDEPEVDYAELRWAREEKEEEERIARKLHHWTEETGTKTARALYSFLCMMICVVMIALLLFTVTELPSFGSPDHPINNEVSARYIEKGLQETGAVNIVTGMILDYRAFDTLGESSVLFTAAMVVLFLLRIDKDSHKYSQLAKTMREIPHSDTYYEPKNDVILQKTATLLVPIVLLLGIYVVLNGHLSPGGGFSGGAIMGAALIMYVIAFGFAKARRVFTYKTYQTVVLVALLTYALSKCYSFYTGANGIHSVIPLGTPGAILSSGLILVLNICVGFIVTCTMYCFYAVFRKGEL